MKSRGKEKKDSIEDKSKKSKVKNEKNSKVKEIKQKPKEEPSFMERMKDRIAVIKEDGTKTKVGENSPIKNLKNNNFENEEEKTFTRDGTQSDVHEIANGNKELKKEKFGKRKSSEPNSYSAIHKNKKGFRPYTLKDFKTQKEQYKGLRNLGGLGPDLANTMLRHKKTVYEKKMKYASEIFVRNKMSHEIEKEKSPKHHIIVKKEPSKREKAILFAKQVHEKNMLIRIKKQPNEEEEGEECEQEGEGEIDESTNKMLKDQFGTVDEKEETAEQKLMRLQQNHESDKEWILKKFK